MDPFVVRRLSVVTDDEVWGVYERTPGRGQSIKLVSKHALRREAREEKDRLLSNKGVTHGDRDLTAE